MAPMEFTEYDTRLGAYAAIVDEHDRILLTWFNGGPEGFAPGWTMPGGGVDFDESVEDAVVREVAEETGYVIELGAPFIVDTFTRPGWGGRERPFKSARIVFHARIVSGEIGTTEVGGTTDEAAWIPIPQVPDLDGRADIVDVTIAALRDGR